MEDKIIMSTVLGNVKGMCDLMMHGTVEAATPAVRAAFDAALEECLCMQADIYAKMAAKGWYPAEQAEQQKIEKVKQKFASM